MAFTKEQIGRMTSDEYKQNIGDERVAPLTEAQKEFRALVDGPSVSSESSRPAPRNTSNSPRGRAEAVNVPAEPPIEKTFDPSFDESPTQLEPVTVVESVEAVETAVVPAVTVTPVAPVAPVAPVVPPPAPVELPEKIHEYQPKDKAGRAIGGIQRFKYRTQDELIEKLTKAHEAASAKIRELVEEKVLNGTEVPVDATPASQLQFRPVLEEAERTAWQEKLQDPASAAQAQYMLDRDDDRHATNAIIKQNFDNSVLLAIESFKNRNRDYFSSQENAVKLVGYIERRGLDPTDARNYQKAYDVLRESGIIAATNQPTVPELALEAPTVREEKTVPNTQAPAEATARISPEVLPQERTVAPIPTGLSNVDQTSDTDNPIPKPHWHTIRVWRKDAKGQPTSQYEEFHDLDAIDRSDDKTLKRIISDQSPRGKALRAAWEAAEAEKQHRIAENKRKFGWS